MRSGAILVSTLALAAAPALVAQVPTQTLAKAEAELAEPFSQVGGIREQAGGKVLVSDRRERLVHLGDFARGTVAAVGRNGAGPGEYDFPGPLFALPGDSTLLFDIGNSRFLTITPDGKPGDTFRPDFGEGGGPMSFLRAPDGADAKGRLYFLGRPIAEGPDGRLVPQDSAPVYRYDRASNRVDTLGYIKLAPLDVNQSGGEGQRSVMIRQTPLAPQDAWGVAPDGRVGVARVATNHVEWWGPTGRVKGPAVPYTPIKVTEGDKKAWAEQAMRGAISMEVNNGRRTTRPATRPPSTEGLNWPETKPPFAAGGVAVTPEGELWLLRSRPASDPVPSYDVFDAQGRVVKRVLLPKGTRLVGFGKGTAYLVRADDDGLEYLMRFKR